MKKVRGCISLSDPSANHVLNKTLALDIHRIYISGLSQGRDATEFLKEARKSEETQNSVVLRYTVYN